MTENCNSFIKYNKSGNGVHKFDNVLDLLVDFDRLRISALTKAAEISSVVTEATIGPNSPLIKKTEYGLKFEDNTTEPQIINEVKDDVLEQQYFNLAKECESQLQNNCETIFKKFLEKMITNRTEIMGKFWKKQQEDYERKFLLHKARKVQMLKKWHENDNLSVLEKAKSVEQNNQYDNRKTIENMNRILEEQNKAAARFASITDSHTKICVCYNLINDIVLSGDCPQEIYDKYSSSIYGIVSDINNVLDLCKSGMITDQEVTKAQNLAIDIEILRKSITDDITGIKEHKLKVEEENHVEQVKKETSVEMIHENLQNEQEQIEIRPFYSVKNYTYFRELKKFLITYESLYKDLLENTSLKKYRFDCQKAVNTPVNAVSSVSGSHLKDKYDKLSKLLKGEGVQIMGSTVSVTQHPQGLAYCTALLAKKIVRQGDLLVSSNPEAAFPLASIAVALWAQFPDFGRLLEANFQKECPYLVPMLLPQKKGQSDQDFYKSRGYTYSNEGEVERQDKFLKRMSGIFRLCCAIWITKPPKFINSPNPHGLKYAWKWLSSFINLKPEPDICATLLFDFFTICGSEFFKYYGKQFIKIIKIISTDYLAILENLDEGGPKTRLEVFLQSVIKTGNIPPPSGLLSQNTW